MSRATVPAAFSDAQAPMSEPAMRGPRLSMALEEGLVLPKSGPLVVIRPRAGEDFSLLPRDRLTLVQSFRPDFDALSAAGYKLVSELPCSAAAVMVCLPRAKAEGLAMIARAMQMQPGLIIVDGQKTDGIDSVNKTLRARVDVAGVVSKAHGKIFWFAPGADDLSDLGVARTSIECPELGSFRTASGVFSATEVDAGSRLLAQSLPEKLPAHMADLGAGWGYLAAAVLRRDSVAILALIEAEKLALDCARANITDPRASFAWADATRFTPPTPFGGIVMNPPFHTARRAEPALGLAFIAAAARMLTPKGRLWMVANRHLPYGRALEARFVTHDIVAETPSFRVFHAHTPRRHPEGQSARGRRPNRTGN